MVSYDVQISALKRYSNSTAKMISAETSESGRLYVINDGTGSKKYPSVTTVINHFSDKTHLQKWRARVGNAEADRISKESAARGTGMHNLLEAHFTGHSSDYCKDNPIAKRLFRKISPFLKDLEPIALECPLYSHHLQVAGRCDFIGYHKGKLAIVDFKTSKRERRAEWNHDYFLQATFYSLMLYEMFLIPVTTIVLYISVEEGFPQIFREKTQPFIQIAVDMAKEYNSARVA